MMPIDWASLLKSLQRRHVQPRSDVVVGLAAHHSNHITPKSLGIRSANAAITKCAIVHLNNESVKIIRRNLYQPCERLDVHVPFKSQQTIDAPSEVSAIINIS